MSNSGSGHWEATDRVLSGKSQRSCWTCFEAALKNIKKFAYQMLNILHGTQWKYKCKMPPLP